MNALSNGGVDYKETGQQRKEARTNRSVTSKVITLTALIAILTSLASCNNDKKNYEDGVTQGKIERNNQERNILVKAYDYYYSKLEELREKYNSLREKGDYKGAKEIRKQYNKLKKELKKTEKEIDKRDNNKIKYDVDLWKGKVASEGENAELGDLSLPPRRIFY